MSQLRCAAYLRISTSLQNPLSPEDQLRKCREFATRENWAVLDSQIYSDEALSGVGADRPGLTRLMAAAESRPRPFDVVLVDDSSRLSRSLSDAMRIFERLNFAGVRVVAVSQGIDSQNDQADVLVTFHGLMDSMYVKELAKKTHRGMEGALLRGFHTGGSCFGYRTTEADGGKQLRVFEPEAAIVRRIFEMSAVGAALKTIAKTLNAEGIPSPRARKGRPSVGGWCPTGIREMLHNERYVGRIVWNRSKFVKVPGTNKRVARLRPQSEWKTRVQPHLRIVSDELWERVRTRLSWLKENYRGGRPSGLCSPRAGSRYLFSGILVCSECGARLSIVTGTRKNDHPRWGCPRNFNRGTCSNDLRERNEYVEKQLLGELQRAVLHPEAVEYALTAFEKALDEQLTAVTGGLDKNRERLAAIDAELGRLAEAVAIQGSSRALMTAISAREAERTAIERSLLGSGPGSIKAAAEDAHEFAREQLRDIRSAAGAAPAEARMMLAKHVDRIVMRPTRAGDERFYIAEGEWDLLGKYEGRPGGALRILEMVAGVRFELTTFGL